MARGTGAIHGYRFKWARQIEGSNMAEEQQEPQAPDQTNAPAEPTTLTPPDEENEPDTKES